MIASDGHRSRFDTFTLFVRERQPGAAARAAGRRSSASKGSRWHSRVTAGDPDGDAARSTRPPACPPAPCSTPRPATFTWTPGFEQAGTYTVTFTASDPGGLSDSMQVELRDRQRQSRRRLAPPTTRSRLGSELRFFVQASDPDAGNDARLSAASTCPRGRPSTRRPASSRWRPGPGQAGEFLVGLTASDGQASASQMIVIRAAIEPPAPHGRHRADAELPGASWVGGAGPRHRRQPRRHHRPDGDRRWPAAGARCPGPRPRHADRPRQAGRHRGGDRRRRPGRHRRRRRSRCATRTTRRRRSSSSTPRPAIRC